MSDQFRFDPLDPKQDKRFNAARAVASRAVGETMPQVAARAGVHERTLYYYLEDDDFRELVIKLTDYSLVQHMPAVDRAMLKEALEGSVQAANYLARRSGRLEDTTRDKSFEEFLKKLDDKDRLELEYYAKHRRLPDQDRVNELDEPEQVQ